MGMNRDVGDPFCDSSCCPVGDGYGDSSSLKPFTIGDSLPDELVKELVGTKGVDGKGGVVPSEEFVRLDGGEGSSGDSGGVALEFISADQMVCPGKEPKLPVVPFTPLDEEAGTGT